MNTDKIYAEQLASEYAPKWMRRFWNFWGKRIFLHNSERTL